MSLNVWIALQQWRRCSLFTKAPEYHHSQSAKTYRNATSAVSLSRICTLSTLRFAGYVAISIRVNLNMSLTANVILTCQTAVVTGGRFHTALRLLRCGKCVVVSSQYTRDAKLRY